MNKITYILLSLLTAISLLLPSQTFAANKPQPAAQIFSISPIILNVPLSPGKTYTREIIITNLTNKPLPLQTSLNDFQTTGEEGEYVFADTRTSPLLSWITLTNTNLLLSPKEKKKLRLTIKTPNKIPFGGYSGILFFEPVLPETNAQTTRVVSRVGMLLLANIGTPDPHAKVAEIPTFTIDFFQETNHIPLLLRVKNISLHFFAAKPIVTISPLLNFTPNQKPIPLEEKLVFQGKIRRWQTILNLQDAPPNIYKAHVDVSTGNGKYVSSESYFIIFPFTKTFSILIGLLFIGFLVSKRKHLKRAVSVLFKG